MKTQTIAGDRPGRDEDASSSATSATVPFAAKTTLKVDVEPVPGEANTDNNSASYPVIFSLG